MANYTQITDFSAKDDLASGDPNKIAKGSDIDNELAAISDAIDDKADIASPTFTGTVTLPTVAGNRTDSGNITQTGTITMSGKSIWDAQGANVASATDCNIWTTDGNTVHITGVAQIDDWGTAPQAGAWKRVIFDGALILNYDATTNDLPGDSDITTIANDSCIVYARSTSSYQIFDYTRASGGLPIKHEVSLYGTNAHGAVKTKIRRFTSTRLNTGTSITYADTADDGASFTINDTGIYAVSYTDAYGSGTTVFGVSKNLSAGPPNDFTTNFDSIDKTKVLCLTGAPTGVDGCASGVYNLTAGDIVYPHGAGIENATNVVFSITRVL